MRKKDLTEKSLEQAIKQIGRYVRSRRKLLALRPRYVFFLGPVSARTVRDAKKIIAATEKLRRRSRVGTARLTTNIRKNICGNGERN